MQDLLEQTLEYARVAGAPFRTSSVSTSELVSRTLDVLAPRLEAAGAEVVVGDLPVVSADPLQLGRVFLNLVGNALAHARAAVAPRVIVSARPVPVGWEFAVDDNGHGIPAAHREGVFDGVRCSRGSATGGGMGLAICRHIVERHGGRIWVEDAPEGGARLVFVLPDLDA